MTERRPFLAGRRSAVVHGALDVREARADELAAVLNVLDGALLDAPPAAVREGTTLVAGEDGRLLGALVLDGDEIRAVAVRRRRRGQGVGTALVAAAAARRDRLVAEFDPRVRGFYEALGFDVEPVDGEQRLRGTYRSPD